MLPWLAICAVCFFIGFTWGRLARFSAKYDAHMREGREVGYGIGYAVGQHQAKQNTK